MKTSTLLILIGAGLAVGAGIYYVKKKNTVQPAPPSNSSNTGGSFLDQLTQAGTRAAGDILGDLTHEVTEAI